MLVLPKRNIDLPGPDGVTVRLRRGVLTDLPDRAAETVYFRALVADGKVVPSGGSDKETQAAAEKKVKTRRGGAVSEE